jgi:hypothetical protein
MGQNGGVGVSQISLLFQMVEGSGWFENKAKTWRYNLTEADFFFRSASFFFEAYLITYWNNRVCIVKHLSLMNH